MSNKLSLKTKLLYGLGFSSQGIKDGLFQVFLFFYFSQVLGLDPALTGISTVFALVFDAVSDPLVGNWSDSMKTKKLGRRHPWMFASAIPLGLFIYLLFLPPSGLGQMGLFWWMTAFTILVRIALTMFIVPAMSLGAELSDDYEERTSVTTFRIAFAAFISPLVIVVGLVTYFEPTAEMSNGLLNAEAYPKYALLCGILIVIAVFISSWGTIDQIPNLPQNTADRSPSIQSIITGFKNALKLSSYKMVVSFVMIIYIGIGVGTTLTTYFTTYFFELSEKELAILPLATALSGLLSFVVAPGMSRRLGKRKAAIISTIFFALFFSLPFLLRMLGVFPENGSPGLILAYFITLVIAYLFVWVALSVANSMMADIVDESELQSGVREEGLFFATMSFAYKCTVGFGYLIAGFLLKWIAFPSQINVSDVSQTAINGLGYIGGFVLLTIYIISLLFIRNYPIDKARYQEIRTALEATRA